MIEYILTKIYLRHLSFVSRVCVKPPKALIKDIKVTNKLIKKLQKCQVRNMRFSKAELCLLIKIDDALGRLISKHNIRLDEIIKLI